MAVTRKDSGYKGGQLPPEAIAAFSSRVPLNLALITVEVMAGNTVFLSAIIELVPAPANITLREMTSYVNLCA